MPATSTIAPARIAAAHVLLAVERGTAHADDQLRTPRVEALSRQDRDLVNELVLGTLRWQLVLDREIAARLSRPDLDMHFLVIIALRLGAYQLLFLDRIPAHAAVNDSVEQAKQADGPQAANLVNAVLRRIQREAATLRSLRSDPASAYPGWLLARWRARFGDAAAQAICAYGQQVPQTAIRLLKPLGMEQKLEREADRQAEPEGRSQLTPDALQPGAFLRDVRCVPTGKPSEFPDTRIQDEASQLVGEIAAFRAGPRILDACAAPGGKTAILAQRNPAAEVTAMDVSATRLRIMQRRLPWNQPSPDAVQSSTEANDMPAEKSDRVRFTPGDASTLAPGSAYDTILCDVPCSGTGTLARNPEIRVRLNEAAIGRQAERQRAILHSALGALRPGGRLVYSTCSLEQDENEEVVEAALALHPSVAVEPVQSTLDGLQAAGILTPEGHARLMETALAGPYLRTIPGLHPCDGFFAAMLIRR